MPGSVTNTFSSGETIDYAKTNQNFSDLASHVVTNAELVNKYSLVVVPHTWRTSTESGERHLVLKVPAGQVWEPVEFQLTVLKVDNVTTLAGTIRLYVLNSTTNVIGGDGYVQRVHTDGEGTTVSSTIASGQESLSASSVIAIKLDATVSLTADITGTFLFKVKHLA